MSAVAFAWVGTIATLVAAISILVGAPEQARDLAPLGGLGDLTRRFGEFAPIVAAMASGIVAAVVAAMIGSRRLDPVAGGLQLFVLGAVTVACVLGATGRVGHATDGSVMIATLCCVAGGAAIAAGGIVALLGRE